MPDTDFAVSAADDTNEIDWTTLDAQVTADKVIPEDDPPADTTAAPVPTPTPSAPAAAPAAAPEPAAKPAEDPVLARVRTAHMTPINALVATILGRNPDIDPEAALAMARQQLGEPAPASPPPGEQPPPEEVIDPIETLEAELAQIDAQLEQASVDGGVGSLYDKSLNDANRRRAEIMAELSAAKVLGLLDEERQAAVAADTDAKFAAQRQAAVDASIAQFPELESSESPLALAVMEEITLMNQIMDQVQAGDESALADPDVRLRYTEYAHHPEFPKLAAARHAARLGIQPAGVAAGGAVTVPPSGNPQPTNASKQANPPQMTPTSAAAGGARVEISPQNPDDAWKTQLDQLGEDADFADLDKVLSGSGGDTSPWTIR